MSSLLLLATAALAQAPTLPPDEPLRQIQTPRFVVVYPASAEADAQRAASALEHVAGEVEQGMGEHPRRLTVVLNNQLTLSNGYVTLAPRRSGWWTVPLMEADPQVFGTTLSWLDALAVHEYRHVVQLEHARVGSTEAAFLLFGQTGWLVGASLALPPWFLEGDAVLTETALTQSGRGRTPAFLLDLRVELLEDGIPTMSQAVVGSFREKHADHYSLGYALTAYGASHFDPALWSRVSEDAARWFFVPLSFSRQLRQEVGMTLPELHHLAMYELQRGWEEQIQLRGPSMTPRDLTPAPRRGELVDYASPEPQPDGSVIAFRSGNEDPGAIVRIGPDGVEERLARTGIRPQQSISARGGRVVWDETRQHWRWGEKSWSVLRILELDTGEIRDLTEQTRLFSPALAPDGERVAAIEVARDGAQSLVLLDARTGSEIRRFPAPQGERVRAPSWALDREAILVVRQDPREGMALGRLDLDRALWEQLTPWRPVLLSDPVEMGGKVYYISGEAGVEDPWVLDLQTGATARLGTALHGAFSPTPRPDGSALVYADARLWGRALAEVPLPSAPPELPVGGPLPTERWLKPVIAAEAPPEGDVLRGLEPRVWESRPYRRLPHALNVHSWSPVVRASGDYGAAIVSGDVTGSMSATAGLWYRPEERALGGGGQISWEASLIALDLGLDAGRRSVLGSPTESLSLPGSVSWTEQSLALGLRLPMQASEGPWLRSAELGLWAEGGRIADLRSEGALTVEDQASLPGEEGTFLLAGYDARWTRQAMSTSKELAPRLYQSCNIHYSRLLPGGSQQGWAGSAGLALGLPGLARMHRVGLSAGGAFQKSDGYTFESGGVYPRGYAYAEQSGVLVGSLDYRLPLGYPDVGLGGLVYVKRLKADLFYDHGIVGEGGEFSMMRSAGLELVADTSFLRSLGALGLGVRASWLIDEGAPSVEPVLGGSF